MKSNWDAGRFHCFSILHSIKLYCFISPLQKSLSDERHEVKMFFKFEIIFEWVEMITHAREIWRQHYNFFVDICIIQKTGHCPTNWLIICLIDKCHLPIQEFQWHISLTEFKCKKYPKEDLPCGSICKKLICLHLQFRIFSNPSGQIVLL